MVQTDVSQFCKLCSDVTPGVAEGKVGQVVQVVCEKVAHKELSDPLPSASTQARFASEMKVLARKQVTNFAKG